MYCTGKRTKTINVLHVWIIKIKEKQEETGRLQYLNLEGAQAVKGLTASKARHVELCGTGKEKGHILHLVYN